MPPLHAGKFFMASGSEIAASGAPPEISVCLHTRQVITTLTPLSNTRKFLEIDWQNGSAISATSRYGVGYVTQ